jgi:hypothetical protein
MVKVNVIQCIHWLNAHSRFNTSYERHERKLAIYIYTVYKKTIEEKELNLFQINIAYNTKISGLTYLMM